MSPPAIPGWVRADAAPARSVDRDGRSATMRFAYDHRGREIQVLIVETLSPQAKLPGVGARPGRRHTVA